MSTTRRENLFSKPAPTSDYIPPLRKKGPSLKNVKGNTTTTKSSLLSNNEPKPIQGAPKDPPPVRLLASHTSKLPPKSQTRERFESLTSTSITNPKPLQELPKTGKPYMPAEPIHTYILPIVLILLAIAYSVYSK